LGETRATSLSLLTTSPARSTNAIRMSRARRPEANGLVGSQQQPLCRKQAEGAGQDWALGRAGRRGIFYQLEVVVRVRHREGRLSASGSIRHLERLDS
jgi:hypothetical protein